MADFVKLEKGLQDNYDALNTKDNNTVYICSDTGRCYLGEKLLSPRVSQIYTGGLEVYYNGANVTLDEDLDNIVANAVADWYGTQFAYNELVDSNDIQAGVLYHIEVQADWNETDPKHLGYIKNKPNVLNMSVSNNTAKFYYV